MFFIELIIKTKILKILLKKCRKKELILCNNLRKNYSNSNLFNKSDIPDFIFETLILLYELHEDIKNKIKKKIKNPEKYYLINYGWIEKFKECFNYLLIKNKLQNYKKYNKFYEFKSNMKILLEDIKKLNTPFF